MRVDDWRTKRILFADYDKFFRDLHATPDNHSLIFYRRGEDDITISFSYDAFVIITTISIEEIQAMYADAAPNTYEVATDDTGEDPAVVRFFAEYLPRGIPEVD